MAKETKGTAAQKNLGATIGTINAMKTLTEDMPDMSGTITVITEWLANGGSLTQTFDVLELLFKVASPLSEEEIMEFILGKIVQGMSVDVIEDVVKKGIMAYLTTMIGCYSNPIIPDYMFAKGDAEDSKGPKFNGTGMQLPWATIDVMGSMYYAPYDKVGRYYYFDTTGKGIDDIISQTSTFDVKDFWKSKDFNAFMWYVYNRGQKYPEEESLKLIWDNRYQPYRSVTEQIDFDDDYYDALSQDEVNAYNNGGGASQEYTIEVPLFRVYNNKGWDTGGEYLPGTFPEDIKKQYFANIVRDYDTTYTRYGGAVDEATNSLKSDLNAHINKYEVRLNTSGLQRLESKLQPLIDSAKLNAGDIINIHYAFYYTKNTGMTSENCEENINSFTKQTSFTYSYYVKNPNISLAITGTSNNYYTRTFDTYKPEGGGINTGIGEDKNMKAPKIKNLVIEDSGALERKNTFSKKPKEFVGQKVQLAKFQASDGNGAGDEYVNMWIMPQKYYQTGTILGTNKTVLEFDSDFLSSIRLFETRTFLATLLNSLYKGAINSKLSFSSTVTQGIVSKIISKVLSADDTNTEDCFYSFTNDDYNDLLVKAENQRKGINNGVVYNTSDILSNMDSVSSGATLQEKTTAITNSFTSVTATKAQEPYTTYEAKFGIAKILESFETVIFQALFTPKVMTLIIFNQNIIGKETSTSFNDVIQSLVNIGIYICRNIKDKINDILKEAVINIVTELSKNVITLFLLEQWEQYREVLSNLMTLYQKCFGTSSKGVIDNVTYADIEEPEITSNKNGDKC